MSPAKGDRRHGSDRRAQTEFDYVVGMTLVLLTLSGVFLFVPGIFQPFERPVDTNEKAASERVANHLVSASAVDGAHNTVNYTTLETLVTSGFDRVRRETAAPASINVTLAETEGGRTKRLFGAGLSYAANEQPSATTVRVVRVANGTAGVDRCDPACRLVVRVW